MSATTKKLADVLPADYDSVQWREAIVTVMDVAQKRRPEDPKGWADEWLRGHYDAADLRALGYCHQCGQPITLRQVGHCVYSEPCGHFRAQGELKRMQAYIDRARASISPERRAAVLALIGQ